MPEDGGKVNQVGGIAGRLLRRRSTNAAGCWNWTGCRNSDGYGHVKVAGRIVGVHRVSYEAHIGPIPDGQEVCHRCDNPACFNPEHLFLGTHLENVRDMRGKGRAYSQRDPVSFRARLREAALRRDPLSYQRGDENGARKHPERLKRGSARRDAKLNETAVSEIRKSKETQRTLAARFGVSQSLISLVRSGRFWTHVPRGECNA